MTQEQMQRWLTGLSPRERFIFALSIFFVGSALLGELVLRPYRAWSKSLDSEIEAREIRLAKYKRWVDVKESASPLLALLSEAQPTGKPEEEMSRLLKHLEAMARRSSVRITDLKPLAAEKKDAREMLSVELQTEAPLVLFAHFLYELETSPLLLTVHRFHLAAGENSAKLKATLAIHRTLFLSEARPQG